MMEANDLLKLAIAMVTACGTVMAVLVQQFMRNRSAGRVRDAKMDALTAQVAAMGKDVQANTLELRSVRDDIRWMERLGREPGSNPGFPKPPSGGG